MSACSTLSSEARPNLVKAVNDLDKEIEAVYLVPCEWPIGMLSGQDTLEDHLHIDKINIDRHKECYLRHNGLIDILNERNQTEVE